MSRLSKGVMPPYELEMPHYWAELNSGSPREMRKTHKFSRFVAKPSTAIIGAPAGDHEAQYEALRKRHPTDSEFMIQTQLHMQDEAKDIVAREEQEQLSVQQVEKKEKERRKLRERTDLPLLSDRDGKPMFVTMQARRWMAVQNPAALHKHDTIMQCASLTDQVSKLRTSTIDFDAAEESAIKNAIERGEHIKELRKQRKYAVLDHREKREAKEEEVRSRFRIEKEDDAKNRLDTHEKHSVFGVGQAQTARDRRRHTSQEKRARSIKQHEMVTARRDQIQSARSARDDQARIDIDNSLMRETRKNMRSPEETHKKNADQLVHAHETKDAAWEKQYDARQKIMAIRKEKLDTFDEQVRINRYERKQYYADKKMKLDDNDQKRGEVIAERGKKNDEKVEALKRVAKEHEATKVAQYDQKGLEAAVRNLTDWSRTEAHRKKELIEEEERFLSGQEEKPKRGANAKPALRKDDSASPVDRNGQNSPSSVQFSLAGVQTQTSFYLAPSASGGTTPRANQNYSSASFHVQKSPQQKALAAQSTQSLASRRAQSDNTTNSGAGGTRKAERASDGSSPRVPKKTAEPDLLLKYDLQEQQYEKSLEKLKRLEEREKQTEKTRKEEMKMVSQKAAKEMDKVAKARVERKNQFADEREVLEGKVESKRADERHFTPHPPIQGLKDKEEQRKWKKEHPSNTSDSGSRSGATTSAVVHHQAGGDSKTVGFSNGSFGPFVEEKNGGAAPATAGARAASEKPSPSGGDSEGDDGKKKVQAERKRKALWNSKPNIAPRGVGKERSSAPSTRSKPEEDAEKHNIRMDKLLKTREEARNTLNQERDDKNTAAKELQKRVRNYISTRANLDDKVSTARSQYIAQDKKKAEEKAQELSRQKDKVLATCDVKAARIDEKAIQVAERNEYYSVKARMNRERADLEQEQSRQANYEKNQGRAASRFIIT